MLDKRDFLYLVNNPNNKVKRFKKLRNEQLLKQRPVECNQLEVKINKLKKKINLFPPIISNNIMGMINTIVEFRD